MAVGMFSYTEIRSSTTLERVSDREMHELLKHCDR